MRTVAGLRRQAQQYKEEERYLHNPLPEDFFVDYEGKSQVIRSKETKKFPKYIAKHIEKHLVDAVLMKKSSKDILNAEVRAEIKKEIRVDDIL